MKWTFAIRQKESMSQGSNLAVDQNFRSGYDSLVRESIQNSLDASLLNGKPTKVVFTLGYYNIQDEGFFDLEKHIAGCYSKKETGSKAYKIYGQVHKAFESINEECSFKYLKISDYNTKGMNYIPDQPCRFNSFIKSIGDSFKDSNYSAGSYGFGKNAFILASRIRTFFVSSKSNGCPVFQGLCSLSDNVVDNVKYEGYGFYGGEQAKPITNDSDIPSIFRRKEQGSDVYVIDYLQKGSKNSSDQEVIKVLMKAVIKNFYFAIREKNLVVDFEIEYNGKQKLNDQNINEWAIKLFKDDTAADNILPFINAYEDTTVKPNNQARCFCIDDDLMGDVRFFISKTETPTDKVIFLRKQKMLVQTKKRDSAFGYVGIFICDGELGNARLQNMEPAAHDRWDKKYCNTELDAEYGSKCLERIEEIINKNVEIMFPVKEDEVLDVPGLEDYAYIMTEDENENDSDNLLEEGIPTGSLETSQTVKERSITSGVFVQVNEPTQSGSKQPGGKSNTDRNKGKGKNNIGVDPSDIEEDTHTRSIKSMPYRYWANSDKSGVSHYLLLKPEEKYSNIRIDIKAANASSSSNSEIIIKSASAGKLKKNGRSLYLDEVGPEPLLIKLVIAGGIKYSLVIYPTIESENEQE